MKKIVLLTAILMMACNERKAEEFVVKGNLVNVNLPVIVNLNYQDDKNHYVHAEYISRDGSFRFRGKATASAAEIFLLPYHPKLKRTQKEYWEFVNSNAVTKNNHMKSRSFFLEAAEYEFEIDSDVTLSALKTDSKNQEIYNSYKVKLEKLNEDCKATRLLKERCMREKAVKYKIDSLQLEVIRKEKRISGFPFKFAKMYYNSKVALLALKEGAFSANLDQLELSLNELSKDIKSNAVAEELNRYIETSKNSRIGSIAHNFSLKDKGHRKEILSSHLGKYVLVTFWASWSITSRDNNEELLEIYNKYKNKDFTIISVSVDENRASWIKALDIDQLPWINVIDEAVLDTSAAEAYGISMVPTNFLIDPQGVIVDKNLSSEKLDKKLEQILDNN